jgi:tRNA-specific 2-thiouridylase
MKVADNSAYPEYRGKTDDDAVKDAAAVAKALGFPHYAIDLRKEFRDAIIENFKSEYLKGRTPNPCAVCNPIIKWDEILKFGEQFEVDYMATGHYAQIQQQDGRFYIQKGVDKKKDQSYMLWGLSQKSLARTMLPLGSFSKDKIREIAAAYGFKSLTQKKESFEICFIPDDDYRRFLRMEIPGLDEKLSGGKIYTTDGQIVGEHRGFPFYTIGQRRGLEVALGEPMYVNRIDADANSIVIGRKESLMSSDMYVEQESFQKVAGLQEGRQLTVKVRYHHSGEIAIAHHTEQGLMLRFKEPVSAITPGQSAVFYDGDDVLGGAIISHTA